MRYGVSMPNAGDPAVLMDLAEVADQSGWDGFFLWDHIHAFPQAHDPWVLLGAIAARTAHVRLGTLVTPVPRRRPWKLAKEVVTLDHLSGGRAVLGVGLGVPADTEYGAFGEPTSAREHASLLDEALPLLDAFLRGERVDHEGEHYQVHAQLDPPAVQRPRPPIWIAVTARRKRPLARARRFEGIFPLLGLEAPTPGRLAELMGELAPPEGYDVVAALNDEVDPAELEAAGATWGIDGPGSPDEPWERLRSRILEGPPK